MLQVQVPIPNIRSRQIPHHAHDGAGIGVNRIAIDRLAADIAEKGRTAVPLWQDGRNRQVTGSNCASRGITRSINDGAGRNVGESKGVVESEERFPVHRLIHQTASTSEYGVSFSSYVPCETEAGPKVFMIGVVRAAHAVPPRLNESCGRIGIEISQQVVGFRYHRAVLVAHSHIDSKILGHSPIVLDEETISPVMQLAGGITGLNRCLKRVAGKKIFQRSRVRESYAAKEGDASAGVAKSAAIDVIAMEFAAEL